MWNNTDYPLAYLITFRCRGTWLHGDERGSTDRFHHVYRAPHIEPNVTWKRFNERTLKSEPVTLNAQQRDSVERAINETCTYRQWWLQAMSVRTNHIHVVVSIGETRAELALNALKANATRQIRQDGNWKNSFSRWADKGSQRYLWNERSVALAVVYVVTGQGGPLPEFD